MPTRRQFNTLLAGLPVLGLMACGGDRETAAAECSPILLTDAHECVLCGMTVVRFPGPKGQACLREGSILTFCSVHDLLAWGWQPESGPALGSLHVHDLSRTVWDQPSDDAYMDARAAVYVVGHDQRGAMGHSPAPFSRQVDAGDFAARHGGDLSTFEQLGWDSLRAGPGAGHGGHRGHGDHGDDGHSRR
jgi:copper chaperone NosL